MSQHRRTLTPGWLTAARRRRLYVVAAAATVVAGVYGVLTGTEAAAWLGLVGAVLGVAADNAQGD